MIVTVDDRVGSRELLKPLRRAGCDARLHRLDFGDVALTGNGPEGEVRVGYERKKVDELVGAITDSRFVSRQLPGMLATYPVSYLIIEGSYRQGSQGELLVGAGRDAGFTRQRILYDTFEHFLTSIQVTVLLRARGRLLFKRTTGFEDTVAFLRAQASWWKRRWQDHGTFKVVDEAGVEAVGVGFEEQSTKRSLLAQLPGVYHTRSRVAAEHFPSIHHAIAGRRMTALEATRLLTAWRQVPGIGPKTARRIVRCLREEA